MGKEASFTFTTPLNVNIVEMKDGEHLFVEGDISSNHLDLVNDIMNKNCQESMQRQVLERNMKLDLEHEAFKGSTHEEKEINKTKIPAGKLIDATVKDLGNNKYSTRVKGEINRHNPNYKNTKGNLLEGYLDAFSVAFLPISIKYQTIKGKDITLEQYFKTDPQERVRILNDVKLLNVALTGNPCNTKAQLTEVMTKSMDALEDYKKLKELDPSIEDSLIVKNNKENPLSYVWNKIYSGKLLDKLEQKLLKAAIDVSANKGTSATLVKELFDKIVSGIKLSYKEYYIFKYLIEVEEKYEESEALVLRSKSHSTDLVGNNQLNKPKNSNKMTDDNPKEGIEGTEGEGAEGTEGTEGNVEGEVKSLSASMKTMAEKYDTVIKENESIKADMKTMSECMAKITKALEKPIHKSAGAQETDAAAQAKANKDANPEGESVDPLSLF